MQKNKTKVIFFGTADFAVPALEALKKEGYDIVAVVTTPDKPKGRKQILTPPSIKLAAQKLGLNVLQPPSLKNPDFLKLLTTHYSLLTTDVGVVAAYGKLIPPEIFNLPKHGIVVVHPSLLPKYRGPSPIQTAILNGEKTTGVTIMKIDEELDHGPTISSESYKISDTDLFPTINNEIWQLSTRLLIKTLPDYLSGKIKPQPQDHTQATFTKKFTTEDGEIKPNDTPEQTHNKIRALNPEPGVFIWFEKNGKKMRLKILEAELAGNRLEFKKVQLEGGRPMSIKEFLAGHPNFVWSVLK